MDLNFFGPTYINEINNYESEKMKKEEFADAEPVVEVTPATKNEEIIAELLPVFKNDREAAIEFLQDIKDAKPNDITKRVKRLVSKGIIAEDLCHKYLYDTLCKYSYYDKTIQNWNSQV